jgi:hypothetical protein
VAQGKVRRLDAAWDGCFDPQISRGWVAWVSSGDPGSVFAIDLTDGERTDIPQPSEGGRPTGLAMAGHLLVWSGAHGDIVSYDLAAGKQQTICDAPGYQSEPAVWLPAP